MFLGLATVSLPLVQLFASPYLFTVPTYQRPYSWTTKEASQLLEDVSLAAGLDESEPAMPDYFLGAILLLDPEAETISPPPATGSPRVFEVVDGQQRLVTLAMLVSILRDLEDVEGSLPGEEVPFAERLDAMVSVPRDDRDITTRRSRIQLHEGEQPFLEPHVLSRRKSQERPEPEPGLENAIKAVHDQLSGELEGLSRVERRRLARYLIEECHVVVIITRDIDRAHRLFTVLNERGKPLERKDILKAEVLRKLPAGSAGQSLAMWEKAQANLGGEFENFFSHLRFIHGNQKLPIIASMRALVREHGSEQFVCNILSPLAGGFARVRNFEHDRSIMADEALAVALVSLDRLGKSDWIPAAILAMADYPADPVRSRALVVEIERVAFIVRLLGLGAEKRQRRFAAAINAIKAGPAAALSSTAFDITRDEQRTVAHHLKDIHRRNAPLAKLLLMRIEDELSGRPLAIDPADLSVEHVLPLRPAATSNWRRLFQEGDVREACQGSLGNLCLVTPRQNEKAKNRDFAEKLAIYHENPPGIPNLIANLATNQAILKSKTWLANDILEREAALLDVIARLWRIDVMAPGPNGARAILR